MTVMPPEHTPDVAHAGLRIKKRILVALTLASIARVLVLAFVVLVLMLPPLATGEALKFGGLQLLVIFTIVGMLAGGYIIWDIGRTMARIASLMARDTTLPGGERRRDEVGTLMTSFNKMLVTIEQQAAEINTFATRLDAAYKELESTNARLKETSFKDEVTGLYNRRFFSLRLEEELSRYRRFKHPASVVLLDPAGFKGVNDEYSPTA